MLNLLTFVSLRDLYYYSITALPVYNTSQHILVDLINISKSMAGILIYVNA